MVEYYTINVSINTCVVMLRRGIISALVVLSCERIILVVTSFFFSEKRNPSESLTGTKDMIL